MNVLCLSQKIKEQTAEKSKYRADNQLSKLPTVFHHFGYSWWICKLPENVKRKSNLDHVMQVCNCQHPQICISKMIDVKGILHLIATKWHIWGARVNSLTKCSVITNGSKFSYKSTKMAMSTTPIYFTFYKRSYKVEGKNGLLQYLESVILWNISKPVWICS